MVEVTAKTPLGDFTFLVPQILSTAASECKDLGELFDLFSRLRNGVQSQAEAAAYEGSGSHASAVYHARLAAEAEAATHITTDQMSQLLNTPLEIYAIVD